MMMKRMRIIYGLSGFVVIVYYSLKKIYAGSFIILLVTLRTHILLFYGIESVIDWKILGICSWLV